MTELCATFRDLAAQTWRRIGQAARAKLFWSEETNTETLLLSLQERHPCEVIVSATTKRREGRIGADWEWWFTDGHRWGAMRVQAKRIKLPQERFDGLFAQRVGASVTRQIDLLIERARANGMAPVYCFYVHSQRWPALALWPDRHMRADEPTPLGCLIAHASSVRELHSTTLARIATVSFPWHLLVCPDRRQLPLAEHVAAQLRASHRGLPTDGQAVAAALEHVDWPAMSLTYDPPEHVRLLSGRLTGEGSEEADLAIERELGRRELRGVALFRTSTEQQH